jgi:hypothetical protein
MENEIKELVAEQTTLNEVNEEEVRAKVISEFGFDEVDDIERIDKLVAKEVEQNKRLSSAIGQKIKYRKEVEELKGKTTPAIPPVPVKFDTGDLDKRVDEKLEKRDLDSLEYPEEIKTEIQRLAKMQGISVKQASRDPYIVYKITEHEKTKKVEDASISRNHKSISKKDFNFDSPPDVDITTKEGQDTWDAYKKEMVKQGY